ncbi:MAG: hypothetical protein HY438_00395 [DPANN group archaeon]|nr:hypothetical protein [DPANN group archaeon]
MPPEEKYSPAELARLHAEVREQFPELKGMHSTITFDPFLGKPGGSMTTSVPRAGRRYEGYNVYVGWQALQTESGLRGIIAHELAHVVLNLNWLRQQVSPRSFFEQALFT